jgi:PHD/YefM family antitoxin component YafN of YafNO toxin-antitoxin module
MPRVYINEEEYEALLISINDLPSKKDSSHYIEILNKLVEKYDKLKQQENVIKSKKKILKKDLKKLFKN